MEKIVVRMEKICVRMEKIIVRMEKICVRMEKIIVCCRRIGAATSRPYLVAFRRKHKERALRCLFRSEM
jgi:hypothetical protein